MDVCICLSMQLYMRLGLCTESCSAHFVHLLFHHSWMDPKGSCSLNCQNLEAFLYFNLLDICLVNLKFWILKAYWLKNLGIWGFKSWNFFYFTHLWVKAPLFGVGCTLEQKTHRAPGCMTENPPPPADAWRMFCNMLMNSDFLWFWRRSIPAYLYLWFLFSVWLQKKQLKWNF